MTIFGLLLAVGNALIIGIAIGSKHENLHAIMLASGTGATCGIIMVLMAAAHKTVYIKS